MKLTPLAAGTALLLCSSPPVLAQTERELDAHEHGAATLDVALDGQRLYLDLETPADNVLGFEHAPSTDAQQEAVETARSHLESAEPYTLTAAAGCTLESAEVSIELAGEEADGHHDEDEHAEADHDDHADEDHGDEEHAGEEHAAEAHADEEHADEEHASEEHADDEHASEGHAEEEHADGEHGSEGGTHSDIRTSHVFLCEDPERLAEVTVALFDRYEGFEEIDAQLAGPGGQSAVELSPERTSLSLEAIR